jgi:four helix bundle protein
MNEVQMKRRCKRFALDVIRLSERIPAGRVGDTLARQLIRAGTSVGANYRAACRARSRAEFVAKLGNVEEEADESCFWLELIAESGLLDEQFTEPLWQEADELTAIVTASIRTARK